MEQTTTQSQIDRLQAKRAKAHQAVMRAFEAHDAAVAKVEQSKVALAVAIKKLTEVESALYPLMNPEEVAA